MDYRLLNYWYRQAVKTKKRNMAEMAQAVQIGFGDEKSFKEAMEILACDPEEMKRRKKEKIKETWKKLKAMKKG